MKIFGQAFSKATRSAIGASTPPARDLSPAGTRDDCHSTDIQQKLNALQRDVCSQTCKCASALAVCSAPCLISFSLLYSTNVHLLRAVVLRCSCLAYHCYYPAKLARSCAVAQSHSPLSNATHIFALFAHRKGYPKTPSTGSNSADQFQAKCQVMVHG